MDPGAHTDGADTQPSLVGDLTIQVVDLKELRAGLAAQVTAGYTLSYATPTAGADGHTDPHIAASAALAAPTAIVAGPEP